MHVLAFLKVNWFTCVECPYLNRPTYDSGSPHLFIFLIMPTTFCEDEIIGQISSRTQKTKIDNTVETARKN